MRLGRTVEHSTFLIFAPNEIKYRVGGILYPRVWAHFGGELSLPKKRKVKMRTSVERDTGKIYQEEVVE